MPPRSSSKAGEERAAERDDSMKTTFTSHHTRHDYTHHSTLQLFQVFELQREGLY